MMTFHAKALAITDAARPELQEAMLYEKLCGGRVRCHLCEHRCVIESGDRGSCQVRENHNGSLYSLVDRRPIIQNLDPIEKKPLFHFFPGTKSYSIATLGCNFHCPYCINWEVSQASSQQPTNNGRYSSPTEIVTAAKKTNCSSIAYTYVEPTIFFEYMYDIARLARSVGLKSVLKTNGFMTPEMLDVILPYLNAANVDLKAFREKTYRQFGGALQPVLNTLKHLRRNGVWLEVTTVIIPGLNDSTDEMKGIANFIVTELGVDTPWHVTRFFPAHKMANVPPTPIATLHRTKALGLEQGLHFVYVANLLEGGLQDTMCRHCSRALIKRRGSLLLTNELLDGSCPQCGDLLPGVGLSV